MSGIKDQERIEELRKRLYERGAKKITTQKHKLSDIKEKVKTSWDTIPKPKIQNTAKNEESSTDTLEHTQTDMSSSQSQVTPMVTKNKRKRYRTKLLLSGIGFFVASVVLSSLFLLFGNNSISAENITIAVTGPFTIGGGETLPLQIGITNDNAVDIEAATLIVEYPDGIFSTTDEKKELHIEHLALDTIASGETVNVPLRATVFGEENDEKNIKVAIEYRVQGSNATFFKEAKPLRFKISSSPVSIEVESLKKVSSGQETEIQLVITSNSPTPLSGVVVKAEYPIGFDFVSSNPEPVSSENLWLIEDLQPEESKTIKIKGIIIGKETDEYAINFSVGVPDEKDMQTLASIFVTAQTQFEIENPFIDITMEVGGLAAENVVLEAGESSSVSIEVKNTLSDTVYDMVVEVQLDGNITSDLNIGPPSGYYDSSNNKIIWDVSNAPELQEVEPGEEIRFSFRFKPTIKSTQAPQITMKTNVKARRVSESQAIETLLGTKQVIAKIVSSPKLQSTVGRNIDAFTDTGPVPPVAEKRTTYTISFLIENGSNDIANAEVTAVMPSYVQWLDNTSGVGELTYDSTRHILKWKVNSVDAYDAAFASFQVAIKPSKSQVGETLVLLREQQFKAEDKFTGTVVRHTSPAITTEIPKSNEYKKGNGRVVE